MDLVRLALPALVVLSALVVAGSTPVARAQEEPTDPPPPPATDVPPPPAPTAAPPTAPPADPRDDDEDDEDDEPAPPPSTPEPGNPALDPTRTARPTRTPRTTAIPTGTPFVTGALRVTLGAEPGPSGRATFVVALLNQAAAPQGDLTADIALPAGFALDPVDAQAGQVAVAGGLARWYVASLDPGAEATLRLDGTAAAVDGSPARVCILLVSAGAPLEQCALFDLAPRDVDGEAGATPGVAVAPTASVAGSVVSDLPAALGSGWALLLLGLVAFGAWVGLQARGRRGAPGDPVGAADQGPVRHSGEGAAASSERADAPAGPEPGEP